jgi:hypothetical protein
MSEKKTIKIYSDGERSVLKIPSAMVENLEHGDSGGLIINLPPDCHDCHMRDHPVIFARKELPPGYVDQFSRACKALIATTCGRNRFCRGLMGLISFSTLLLFMGLLLWVVFIKK